MKIDSLDALAGRRLDAVVAREIFGIDVSVEIGPSGAPRLNYYDIDLPKEWNGGIPHFSTDGDWAQKLEEPLFHRFSLVLVGTREQDNFLAAFQKEGIPAGNSRSNGDVAKSKALATSRAAVRAVRLERYR